MQKINRVTGKGASFVLLFFIGALLVVGILLKGRMETLLTAYTENQVRRQAEGFALLAAQKLQTGQDDLAYIASKIEGNMDDAQRLMPLLHTDSGKSQGLLTLDGKALYGDDLSFREFDGIQDSFRGNSAITFVDEEGLLFTQPVFDGVNIRYVLYCLYPTDTIERHFAISCYDELGKLCVMSRDNCMVVPFKDMTKEDLAWFKSKDIQNNYTSMHRDMEVSVAAARSFSTSRGEEIFFEAEIPGTDFVITGFVPKEKATEGIGNITLLVIWVFGLLMLLVLICALYLTNASVKLKESNELRAAKALAEEASRAKSDFLANMSHEIRTPINTVLGMNEMILRESRDNTILAYAGNIKNAGSTLLGLINDILDFSKIEAGKIEILPVDYDLSSVINDLVNMVHTRAEEKGLALNLDFDHGIPRMLNGDEVRVKQIITNILTNAVKYTEKGSVTFRVGYERIAEEPDNVLLRVAVEDTGMGIRPEDMKKLFIEFERIEEKKNRNIEGTGLGMSITKSLLEMMGSSLHVDSEYGVGSTFSFALKQKVVDWKRLGDYRSTFHEHISSRTEYKESFLAPTALILVVDDNPMNLMVFESLVKKTRVRVETAGSGDASILMSQDKRYDIIFLDHMMPRKDGIETLSEIKAHPGNPNVHTPAVCLTANAISGAREKYIEAGFDDYLTKPIDPAKLEEMLLHFLPKDKIEICEAQEDQEQAADDAAEASPEKKKGDGDSVLEFAPQESSDSVLEFAPQESSDSVLEFAPQKSGDSVLEFAPQESDNSVLEFAPQESSDSVLEFAPQESSDSVLEFAPQESSDGAANDFEDDAIPRDLIPLKNLPIDIEAGLTHTVTPDVYLSVLEAFWESIGERAAELNRFYETADWENYTIKVHALKSSARIIGADELGERAQSLENAGQENDIDYIRANHNSFIEGYRAFEEPLSAMFDSRR